MPGVGCDNNVIAINDQGILESSKIAKTLNSGPNWWVAQFKIPYKITSFLIINKESIDYISFDRIKSIKVTVGNSTEYSRN